MYVCWLFYFALSFMNQVKKKKEILDITKHNYQKSFVSIVII